MTGIASVRSSDSLNQRLANASLFYLSDNIRFFRYDIAQLLANANKLVSISTDDNSLWVHDLKTDEVKSLLLPDLPNLLAVSPTDKRAIVVTSSQYILVDLDQLKILNQWNNLDSVTDIKMLNDQQAYMLAAYQYNSFDLKLWDVDKATSKNTSSSQVWNIFNNSTSLSIFSGTLFIQGSAGFTKFSLDENNLLQASSTSYTLDKYIG